MTYRSNWSTALVVAALIGSAGSRQEPIPAEVLLPARPSIATFDRADAEVEGPAIINDPRSAGVFLAIASAVLVTGIGVILLTRVARRRRRLLGERARARLAAELPQLGAILAATSSRSDPSFLPSDPAQHPYVAVARPWSDDGRVAAWERLSERYASHVAALQRASATYIELRVRPMNAFTPPTEELAAQRRVEGAVAAASAAADFARSIELLWRQHR
jgi:hypothetical protein